MSTFSEQATDIGQGIGGFLTPIIGGTTKTTVTETPTEKDNTKNITIAIVVLVVLVVGYFILKPKKAA